MSADFVDKLASELRRLTPDKTAAKKRRSTSLIRFAEDNFTTDKGRWTLKGREPLRYPMELLDRAARKKQPGMRMAILAAEQWGKTVMAVILAIYLVAECLRNVGYFLPTDTFAHKFGRVRLKSLIKASAYLTARIKDADDAVNQATVKEFDGHFLQLMGLESMLGAISWPFDALVRDEVDMLPAENLAWSDGRVAASDLRMTLDVSAGYVPGGGIDLLYQGGSQHKWFVRCGDCKGEWCLEDEFPRCMLKIGERWTRVCPSCQTTIDPDRGRWVATHPERTGDLNYSFRISSLSIGARDAAHIMTRWEKAQRSKAARARFDCAELAKPNAGAMQPIGLTEIQAMRRPYVMALEPSGRARYAGMDTGDICHLWVHERDELGQRKLVWAERIDSDEAEAVVADRIRRLGIVSLVVDAFPLRDLARHIAYAHYWIVALQQFHDGVAPEAAVEDEHEGKKFRLVEFDRNDSLDVMTSAFTDVKAGLVIPDKEKTPAAQMAIISELEDHLMALRKERTQLANGSIVDKYARKVANHFGLAANSARVAEIVAQPHIKITPARFPPSRRSQLTRALGGGDDEDRRGRASEPGRRRSLRRAI